MSTFCYNFGGGVGMSYIKPSRNFVVTGAVAIPMAKVLEDKTRDMRNVALVTFASLVKSECNFLTSTCLLALGKS